MDKTLYCSSSFPVRRIFCIFLETDGTDVMKNTNEKMQSSDEGKELLPNEQNDNKVSDYPVLLVVYSVIATAVLVFLLWAFPNPFVMLLPFFVPKVIQIILKKEPPPNQRDSKVIRLILLFSLFVCTIVSTLFFTDSTDTALGMRYALLCFNTVLGISVFSRFSMPRHWTVSVVVLYSVQLIWVIERFLANPGM